MILQQKLPQSLVLTMCIFRGVWRGLQRSPEDTWEKGDSRGHQDFKRRLHGQTAEGLPQRSKHHGAV